MDQKSCPKDGNPRNFSANTAHRFPDYYKRLHKYEFLHLQMLVASEIGRYSICLRSSNKDKTRMLFVCKHGCVYDLRKSKPTEVMMERTMYIHHSLQKNFCFLFYFAVFYCADDDYWYLPNYPKEQHLIEVIDSTSIGSIVNFSDTIILHH
jgi:hypothetical protein